jgi:hypothetical protein
VRRRDTTSTSTGTLLAREELSPLAVWVTSTGKYSVKLQHLYLYIKLLNNREKIENKKKWSMFIITLQSFLYHSSRRLRKIRSGTPELDASCYYRSGHDSLVKYLCYTSGSTTVTSQYLVNAGIVLFSNVRYKYQYKYSAGEPWVLVLVLVPVFIASPLWGVLYQLESRAIVVFYLCHSFTGSVLVMS